MVMITLVTKLMVMITLVMVMIVDDDTNVND